MILSASYASTFSKNSLFVKPGIDMINEDTIEKFILENKDKFDVYRPPDNHLENFIFKLNYRIRHFINIIPYLIKVAIGTFIIFAASIMIWNNTIRKDRHDITLANKISLVISRIRK